MARDMRLERMQPADWEQVRAIYLQGIATGLATFETEAPSWEAWDDAHLPAGRLVLRSAGRVIGWAALSPASRRPVYAGVAEVSIYMADDWRGLGLERVLLRAPASGLGSPVSRTEIQVE
jgi:phosphinothricin acetyltransferase